MNTKTSRATKNYRKGLIGDAAALEQSYPPQRSRRALWITVVVSVFVLASLGISISPKWAAGAYGWSADGQSVSLSALQVTFDRCIQDDSNGNILRYNSATGDYEFVFGCGPKPKAAAGKGKINNGGCVLTLTDLAPPGGGSLTATIDSCKFTGSASASLKVAGSVATGAITDSNTKGDSCTSDMVLPQVSVSSPNGGQTVWVGSTLLITWTSGDNAGVAGHDILISKDRGVTYSLIGSVAGNVKQYSWTVTPTPDTDGALIRVLARDAACNINWDDSDSVLTILNDIAAPQVLLTGPNGGEILDIGSSYTIIWQASDNVAIASQELLLSTDGGTSFSSIVSGLAPDIRQFAWTVPSIETNPLVRVRIKSRDWIGNAGIDDSDSNLIILDPAAPFTHIANTPIYMLGDGFNSIIHLCNTSAANLTVELGVRNRIGTASVGAPSRFTLAPQQARAIDLATLITPGSSGIQGDPNILEGSIRLRHDGARDGDVHAIVAVDNQNEDRSFTVPFIYAGSQQSAAGTQQAAAMYYCDTQTGALLSLLNITNMPVSLNVVLYYGTGEPGTPNGQYTIPAFTLPGQGGATINLEAFASVMQGTHWGWIAVNAPPQTVIAHTVMMSGPNRLAFNSNFADPVLSASSTKVVSTLNLDYNMDLEAYTMVCNTSATDTRTVTVTFQTDNGVNIPQQQFTLGPRQQRMIELDSRQILPPNGSTMAVAKVSYSGNPSDIIAGAVSMSAAAGIAVPAQSVEARISDGRRLGSPFFRFDERTSAILQITNLSGNAIKAGAIMEFADANLPALNTDLLTLPAGGTATVDLRSYLELVDDGVAARGCLEVIHNGASGDVTATFTAIGKFNNLSLAVPLEGGTPFEPTDMVLFPNAKDVVAGTVSGVAVMSGGSIGAPAWSVSATGANPGSINPAASPDQFIFAAAYTSPTTAQALPVTVTADSSVSGGSIKTGTIVIAAAKIQALSPSRLRPEGGTNFTLTGNKDWPQGALEVVFKQGSRSVSATNVARVANPQDPTRFNTLTGTAPANDQFIGDCQILVRQNGAKIAKDKTDGAAYYAYDPPNPPSSISVAGYNRLGGPLTITAQGGGIRKFMSASGGQELPSVKIGGNIPFSIQASTITDTTISGTVGRAPNSTEACEFVVAQGGCYNITLRNPGGRKTDEAKSVSFLYNLLKGPQPFFESRFPDLGPSMGGTELRITGKDFDFVTAVTIDGTPVEFELFSPVQIRCRTLPHSAASAPIELKTVDRATISGSTFRYHPSTPEEKDDDYFAVGPSESILAQSITHDNGCIIADERSVIIDEVSLPNEHLPGVLAPNRGFRVKTGIVTLRVAPNCPTAPVCFTSFTDRLRAKIVNSQDSGRFKQWNKFTPLVCF